MRHDEILIWGSTTEDVEKENEFKRRHVTELEPVENDDVMLGLKKSQGIEDEASYLGI